ncbi:MAG: BatD family protein [Bacteroidetes bacterium]|nr:BatD family protein [Bacteroidota bacterium]
MLKKIFITGIITLLFTSFPAFAQDVQFRANAKEQVSTGERFQVVYSVNAQGKGFAQPDFESFRVLTGPNVSTSQNYQIINGKMSQSVNVSYSFILQATQEGTFDIPPAVISIDGKEYKSNPLKITVVKSVSSQAPATQSGSPSSTRQTPAGQQDMPEEDDIFIRAYANKTNPYQGEQIIVTYKIYTTTQISDIQPEKAPSFQGFWYKSLKEDNRQITTYSEYVNNREYTVGEYAAYAMFPQKAGELKIEPVILNCVAKIRKPGARRVRDPFFDSFFDDPFFNMQYQNVEVALESNPLTINVKPLPSAGKPAGFNGAVGSFRIDASADKTSVQTNEPITLKYTISGKGNLELINNLSISFPPDIESYEPRILNNIRTSSSGMSGSRTFEYLLIPRRAGTFTIPSVEFSWFDLESQSYKTGTTPEYTIEVSKGSGNEGEIVYSGVAQSDIQYIGSDIRHIKSLPFTIYTTGYLVFGSTLFIVLLIAPILLFILVLVIWRRRIRLQQNTALLKNRKATRVARKNLKNAHEFMKKNQEKEFYTEISRALWGYLSNKFNIPLSELSMENVQQKLSARKTGSDTINAFTATLEHTEYARFAPGDAGSRMNEIYGEALDIITRIEKELKK